jgi:hypothetical protein
MSKYLSFVVVLVFALSMFAVGATPIKAPGTTSAVLQSTTGAFTAHITGIQLGGAPLSFDFTTDNTPSSCNGFIFYNPVGADEAAQIANGKVVIAGLMAAQLSGKPMLIYAFTPTSSLPYCSVQYIWTSN